MQRENRGVAAFYKSSKWKDIRNKYYKSKYGLCERCGQVKNKMIVHHKIYVDTNNINDSNVTLNWNNLELLCIDCHNSEHFNEIEYEFDSEGNLIKNGSSERKIKAL